MQTDVAELKRRIKTDVDELRALRREVDSRTALSEDQAILKLQDEVNSLLDDTFQLVHSLKKMVLSADSLSSFDDARRQITARTYRVMTVARDITQESFALQQEAEHRERATLQFEVCLLVGAVLASLATAVALARWFTGGIVSRLQLITDNILRLERGTQLNAQLKGDDEIAHLDAVFHQMAHALQQSIEKERALFAAANDVMYVLDAKLCITAANNAWRTVLGYSSEQLIGCDIASFIEESARDAALSTFNSLKTGYPAVEFETVFVDVTGKPHDLALSTYWSQTDQALYTVAHDITEQKALERRKQEFLAMVSHDLRAPLTSISASFGLLEVGVFGQLEEAIETRVKAIGPTVNRLIKLVNNLLDMEKLEAGKLELNREKIAFEDLLAKSVTAVTADADEKDITIESESDCGEFLLDGDRTTQVLVNLLSNAVENSPPHSVVNINAAIENNALKVHITDQGPSIPESQQAHLFDRLHKNDSLTGAGLGLPICRLILEQQGGVIGVRAHGEVGNTFWFALPENSSKNCAPPAEAESVGLRSLTAPETKAEQRKSVAGSLFNLRLFQKGLLLVTIPVLFELLFAGSLYPLLQKSFSAKQEEVRQRMLVSAADIALLNLFAVGGSMSLRPLPVSWQAFDMNSTMGIESARTLERLAHADPAYDQLFQEVSPALKRISDETVKAKRIVNRFGVSEPSLYAAYSNRNVLMQDALTVVPVLEQLINRAGPQADAEELEVQKLRRQQGLLLLGGLVASALVSALSALFFSFGIAKRVQAAEATVQQFERGEPLGPSLPGNDEIAYLDKYLHSTAESLKEALYKERAVFDNAQNVICAVTKDGIILRANPAFEKQFGFSPIATKGASLFDMMSDEAAQTFRSVAQDHTSREIETTVISKDAQADVVWSLSWSEQEQAVISIAHDITQRKELERLKRKFLTMVSHDMRTPLTAIRCETAMLSQGAHGALPEAAAPLMVAVEESCGRLLALIQSLLELDELDAGEMRLSVTAVSPARILKRTADSFVGLAADRNIKLVLDAIDSPLVLADEEKLIQVGANLLSNALKFSPSGSTVTLAAEEHSGFVEFRVQDRGRGIPADQLAAVFERFHQVQSSDGKAGAGTGLGLNICQQIVQRLGGEIGVTSEVGVGSTFYFRIPSASASVVETTESIINKSV